jgi:hypothetical protein
MDMRKRIITELDNMKYASIEDLPKIISLGRTNCMKLGREAEAIVKVGGRTLYDVEKILAYLKERTEVER